MSHFVEIRTVFKDQACLIQALREAYGAHAVEVVPEGAALYGYRGDNRAVLNASNPNYAPPCHVIVRRQHIGGSSNDIGYKRNKDGSYTGYVSEFDSSGYAAKRVEQSYAKAVTVKQAKASGWAVTEEKQKDGTVKLQLSKWSA